MLKKSQDQSKNRTQLHALLESSKKYPIEMNGARARAMCAFLHSP